ncbi:helix-turn-helix domain-containing protein [Pseudomonas sp. HK3]
MVDKNHKQRFALNLKRIRISSGKTQIEAAEFCNVKPRTFSRWESMSDSHWPPCEKLGIIAEVFRCRVADLFDAPDWVPETIKERELMSYLKKTNLPAKQIINQIESVLTRLNKSDRLIISNLTDRLSLDSKKK